MVVLLLLYLANNSIPSDNKDIFVSITGMIVGSLSVVIYAIIGRNPDEVAQLQSKGRVSAKTYRYASTTKRCLTKSK